MIPWNNVFYIDCMDKENGLPSLPDKSIDLCVTDPPWNIGYIHLKRGDFTKYEKTIYNDKIEDYELFSMRWFTHIIRVCKRLIFTPGRQNLAMWYRLTEPLDILVHTKKNGGFGGRLSVFNDIDFYLYYGDTVPKPYFRSNHFPFNNQPTGFMKRDPYRHTSPKNQKLWRLIIDSINPESVIDPFLGSGTTAEVCTKLGIPWTGYEINMEYAHDINLRLKNCKKEPKQTFL